MVLQNGAPATAAAPPPIRVLLCDYGGYHFKEQLAHELGRRGHDVVYLVPDLEHAPDPKIFTEGARLQVVPVKPLRGGGNWGRRFLTERKYGGLVSQVVKSLRPNVVIAANTPVEALSAIYDSVQGTDGSLIYWLQDLNGRAARLLLGGRYWGLGTFMGRRHERIERRILSNATAVISIAEDLLIEAGMTVAWPKTAVIPNWGVLPSSSHTAPAELTARLGLDGGRPAVIYSGSLGLKHRPDLLLHAAKSLAGRSDAELVIVTQGGTAMGLCPELHDCSNVRFLDFLPRSDMAALLSFGRVLVATISSKAARISVPSKVLTYLCAGRPIVLAAPKSNSAAQLILSAGAGIVVDPDDAEAFASAVRNLLEDEQTAAAMGARGAVFAREHFDILRIADEFEAVILSVVSA